MKQKKKIISLKQSKKKIVKKIGILKNQSKISAKLLTGTVILFIMLFILVFYSSHEQTLRGNAAQISPVVPTFGSLDDCNANQDCPTGTSKNGGQKVNIQPQNSTNPTIAVERRFAAKSNRESAASNPCTATMSKTTSQSSSNQNFLQLIVQLLQLLLQFFQQLLGGGGSGTTPGNPQPTLGSSTAPSVSPAPATSPCPTSALSPSGSTVQPTSASQPTSGPAPTSGTTATCV